jgi:hypothetical protein
MVSWLDFRQLSDERLPSLSKSRLREITMLAHGGKFVYKLTLSTRYMAIIFNPLLMPGGVKRVLEKS